MTGTRAANEMGALEAQFRGLALQDSLREAAEALAREVGPPAPERRRKEASQFPFATALAQHVRRLDARYGALIEAAPDALLVADAEGTVVLANARAEEQLGLSREDLLGQSLAAVLDGELEPAGEGGDGGHRRQAREMRALRGDGAHFPVEVTTRHVEGSDGQGPLLLVAFRDIGARKSAERRLLRLEARARTLLEHAPDAMLVLNRRGGILLCNGRAAALFGHEAEDLLGQPVTLVAPHGLRERLRAADGSPAVTAVTEMGSLPFRLAGQRRDGTPIALEATLSAVRTAEGVLFPVAFRETGGPVEPLVSEDARLALIEAAPDAMLAIDPLGGVTYFNAQAERRFGYSRHEVLGLPVTRLFPEGFANRFLSDPLAAREASLALELGTGIALPGVTKDGATFPAELMLSTLEAAGQRLTIVSVRDGTVRRKAADAPLHAGGAAAVERRLSELTRLGEELSHFAEVSANQLRLSLRRLMAGAEAFTTRHPGEGAGSGSTAELARTVIHETSRLEALVADLLAYFQLGRKRPQQVRTRLADLVQRAAASLSEEVAASGAKVIVDPLPEFKCDPGEMELLFRNLIANAIAYRGGEAPRVHVSAAPNSAGDWVIAIADNGIGIERHYFERIFQPFQRLNRHGAVPGSGLGLSLCRRIAERHGGRIWVDSRPGLGSTFQLALPVRRQ